VALVCRNDTPMPMNWLSEKKASLASWVLM
jgi:hypothetical protein